MKIIFNGAEYYLSAYLNGLKIPMAMFFAIVAIVTVSEVTYPGKAFKETFMYKNRWKLFVSSLLCGAYMCLVWI